MKSSLLLLVVMSTANSFADGSRTDLLWKARGLQAMERIESLKKEATAGSKDSKCELELEYAFRPYGSPNPDSLFHTRDKKTESFKLMFSDPKKSKEGEGLTVVSILYMLGSKIPSGMVTQALAEEWVAGYHGDSQTITVAGGDCMFLFPFKDPISATAKVKR